MIGMIETKGVSPKMKVLYTVGLLIASNCFMTAAWYGHLKFKSYPLWIVILASWGLAFFEYTLQVPANRIGSGELSTYQLKILQEAITLCVFVIFASVYFGEGMTLRYGVSFALVFAAVAVAFYK
jgi:uncharacterized protein